MKTVSCNIYIPVNFAFNLRHNAASYMYHTGKKESKKKKFKNKKKKKGFEEFASRGSEPGPSETVVRTKS